MNKNFGFKNLIVKPLTAKFKDIKDSWALLRIITLVRKLSIPNQIDQIS